MRERISRGMIVLLGGFLIASGAGCARYPSTSGTVVVQDRNTRVAVVFTDRDRHLIRKYYHRRHLPPGLAKRSSLPPGLRKQVERRGHLPPGLQGRRLPDELEVELSPLPVGYVRLRVDTDIVLMNTRTRVIVDVVKDIGG